ncbi:MAG: transcriptional regulator NrdR [Gammaproteobacteria bacterium]|mgnify:FL=1|nr:transcriptional regulator NrdR [Gammaproteobacteria bacterium]|tara:strand:- start:1196 stop:1696 length:501 start_codon:yes stop_codon:yes gene_type:complete
MHCPFCGDSSTSVIDSRLSIEVNSIRRRRECNSCNKRFNTSEFSELNFPRVVKTDQSSELFSKDKIKKGVYTALEKRKNSLEDIDRTLDAIYNQCLIYPEKEMPSKEIGRIVMNELIKLDHVAYLRFASVYLNFEDINSFRNLIKNLEKDLSPEMKKRQKKLLDDE